jgi:hypothetical protein
MGVLCNNLSVYPVICYDSLTPSVGSVDYGPGDLGKAMKICMAHEQPNGQVYPEGGRPLHWDDAWKACYAVHAEWEKGETARQQREYSERMKTEQSWINEFAKGLH